MVFRFWWLFCLFLVACDSHKEEEIDTADNQSAPRTTILQEGLWRFQLDIGSGKVLPFFVEIDQSGETIHAAFLNAEERLPAESTVFRNDSLIISLPVFQSELRTTIVNRDSISGEWINYAKGSDYRIPVNASIENERLFTSNNCSQQPSDFSGKWEVTFSPGTDDEYKAIGLFQQEGTLVTGTFMTETGDYRYLEGNVSCLEMQLSCFDGSHAFLFDAQFHPDSSLEGEFRSGNHWQEPWVAIRNKDFSLRHPDSLTYLKPGHETLSFELPDLDSNIVVFPSDEFNDKVVIVQLIGSWCPNCMDETKMYAGFYEDYHDKGLEMLSLGFEKSGDFHKASESLGRLKEYFNVEYSFLVAGKADKKEANEVLPMLNHVMSFPTCIFIDRSGRVRKITTGFYGPGTGEYYIHHKDRIESFIRKLLDE